MWVTGDKAGDKYAYVCVSVHGRVHSHTQDMDEEVTEGLTQRNQVAVVPQHHVTV